MKAVIIAAGDSTRTHPLTVNCPKPLLKVANRELIRHNMESLSGLVDGFIIVVGFMKEMIMEALGSSFNGKAITYVEQKERLGTGHALLQAEEFAGSRIIVAMGDDLYGKRDMENCARHENCVLAKEVCDPEKFGVFVLKAGAVCDVIEKSQNPPCNLANAGLYVFSSSIFSHLKKIGKSERGEYELTDAVRSLASAERVACEKVEDYWIPVGYPWHLLDANAHVLAGIEPIQEGVTEPNATIKGNVRIGKGTLVKNGSYIEGPVSIGNDCIIGPNCYIRPCTSVGNSCVIGHGVEIKNSIIMDNVSIGHLSYFGDSIIGSGTNIGAGTISANLRHDGQNVRTDIKGSRVDTGRKKFGAVIGSGVHTGIGTMIYPGRKIWPGMSTLPGEVVREDITGHAK